MEEYIILLYFLLSGPGIVAAKSSFKGQISAPLVESAFSFSFLCTSKRNRTAILPSGGECTIHYAMEAYIRILAGLEMKITIEGVYAVIDPEYGAYESYIIVISLQTPLRYRIDVLWEV